MMDKLNEAIKQKQWNVNITPRNVIRPGKTGHSPRTMVFGTDERLVASGLNHYLEEPDDAAITAASSDAIYRKSMEIRNFQIELQ